MTTATPIRAVTTTRRLSTAAAIVEFLKVQYVERDGVEHRLICGVFGIFGHGNVNGLGQALEEHGAAELPFYQPKNEQGMVHAAVAFAKARRGLGAMACTSSVGPGATNMVTGAATATINRLPVLLLPGDIFAGRGPAPVLQQLEHPASMDVSVNDCFRPVSRYWDRINRPEQLLKALPEAMRVLADPAETGAVTICLPEDVQAEAFDFPAAFFAKRVYRTGRRRCAPQEVARAARLIRASRRPFIIAGGGVRYSGAEQALAAFAEKTGIPVGSTQAGTGTLLDAHRRCFGAVGTTGTLAANRIAEQADLVLVLGSRLSDFTTASKTQFRAAGVRFVAVNVNAHDAHKHGALPLMGDCRAALEDLGAALDGWTVAPAYERELARARADWEKEYRGLVAPKKVLSQAQVIRVLNEQIGTNATVVHAAGGIPGDIHKLWKPKDASDYHSEYGYSCMGYEIAGALGVKLADPKREVYALLGDGSYLMLSSELATSVQEGRRGKITIVMLDNGGYQCIHNLQRSCGAESFGNEFRLRGKNGRLDGTRLAVDYPANAASLGARTFEADSEEKLIEALRQARAETRSCFIYVPLATVESSLPGYSWWDVPVAEASGSPKVRKARQDYLDAKKSQRFYY